ncbi:MAG: hypothetical protein R3F45_13755 [Gammaproteobacteria bacterium]
MIERCAGGEFLVLMPERPRPGPVSVGGKTRAQPTSLELLNSGAVTNGHVTVGRGCAPVIPYAGTSPGQLLAAADALWRFVQTHGVFLDGNVPEDDAVILVADLPWYVWRR